MDQHFKMDFFLPLWSSLLKEAVKTNVQASELAGTPPAMADTCTAKETWEPRWSRSLSCWVWGELGVVGALFPGEDSLCTTHLPSSAPCFPGGSSCGLLPGTGTKQCHGLGRSVPPWASLLEQRSLSGLGGGGGVSLAAI